MKEGIPIRPVNLEKNYKNLVFLKITSILEPHNSQSGESVTGAGEKTVEFPLTVVFTIG